MTWTNHLRKLIKGWINVLAKVSGFQWHTLVDARARVGFLMGLRTKEKKVFVVGLNTTGT